MTTLRIHATPAGPTLAELETDLDIARQELRTATERAAHAETALAELQARIDELATVRPSTIAAGLGAAPTPFNAAAAEPIARELLAVMARRQR